MESIKIKKNDRGYLVATMPDGTAIPNQTKVTLIQGMDCTNCVFTKVELQVWIPMDDFEILKDEYLVTNFTQDPFDNH